MPDYSLGTAEGSIRINYDGKGITQAGKGLDTFEGKARDVQSRFQSIALTTGVAATAIVGGIALAVNSAIDFEARLSAIAAVSGATAEELEVLRKKALQLGADTAFSASESALAMEELVKAGLSVEDVLNGAADATVALAAAGEVALPEAAAIASNAMNQFKLAAQDLPRIADLIAGAANASAIDVGDFGFSLSQAGAVANLVGVEFEDLATAIALMGNQGIKGSDAGTSLKTMLQNLQPTTKRQIELMTQLGILTENGTNKFFDQQGQLKSLADVAGILNTAMKGMSDAQKTMTLETIFGTDAIRAAAVLSSEGAEGFRDMAAAMGEVTAQEVAEKRLDNVAGSIEQLKGSVETAAITFGSQLLPAIRKVTEFVTELVNKFSSLDPRWQKMIAFAAVAAAGLLVLVTALAAVGAVIAGIAASSGILPLLGIILGVIAAVAGLVLVFKKLFEESEAFRNLINTIKSAAISIGATFKKALAPMVAFVRDEIIPRFMQMRDTIKKNLEPAFKAISAFISEKVVPAFEKIAAALEDARPVILAIYRALAGFLFGAFEKIGAVLGWLIPIILKIAGPIFDILIGAIAFLIRNIPTFVNVIKTIINVLKTIGKIIAIAVIAPFYLIYQAGKWVFEQILKIIDGFLAVWNVIWGFIGPVVMAAFGLVMAIARQVFAVVSALFEGFALVVTTIWDHLWKYLIKPLAIAFGAVVDVVGGALGWFVGIIEDSVRIAREIWDKLYGYIVPPVMHAFNIIKDFVSDRLEETKKVFKAVWDAIISFLVGTRDRIVKVIDGFSEMVDKVTTYFTEMKDKAIAKAKEMIEYVKGIPGKAVSALANLGRTLYNSGESLIQGFWDGIKSVWNKMTGWVGDKMEDLRGLWPFSPAKYGPFSGHGWLLYSGRALMEGFAEGIADRAGMVQGVAEEALAGVASRLPRDYSATVSAATTSAGLAAGFAGAPTAGPTSNTTSHNTEININVPLESLRSIKDVQDLLDFIDNLRNDSHRGVEVGA